MDIGRRKGTILICGGCRFTNHPFETTHDAAGDKKMDRHIKTKHPEWLDPTTNTEHDRAEKSTNA